MAKTINFKINEAFIRLTGSLDRAYILTELSTPQTFDLLLKKTQLPENKLLSLIQEFKDSDFITETLMGYELSNSIKEKTKRNAKKVVEIKSLPDHIEAWDRFLKSRLDYGVAEKWKFSSAGREVNALKSIIVKLEKFSRESTSLETFCMLLQSFDKLPKYYQKLDLCFINQNLETILNEILTKSKQQTDGLNFSSELNKRFGSNK